MQQTIICYDITCPRRLARIHRYLKKHAWPLQYSVFVFTGTPTQLDRCWEQLGRLIDPRSDDVRAYPLPQRGLRWSLGAAPLPEGIHCAALQGFNHKAKD